MSNNIHTTANELTVKDLKSRAKQVFELLDVSEATQQDYQTRIGSFLDFIKKTGANPNSFREYKRYLAQRSDLTVSTKNKYLASAKVFLKELARQGTLPTDITLNTKGFNQNKKHKRDGLNDNEVSKLSDSLKRLTRTPQNDRLRAIISLLALQGLRQIELIRLDVKDVDLVNKVAFIQGKGRDDKEPIDLHPEAVLVVKDYLKSNKKKDGALFTSNSNRKTDNQRLTTRSLRRIVTETLKELGIDKSTHGFRHYFTSTLIKTYKGDLLEVAQYTRHRGLEMLQVYNDNIKKKADLPRYYNAFSGVRF